MHNEQGPATSKSPDFARFKLLTVVVLFQDVDDTPDKRLVLFPSQIHKLTTWIMLLTQERDIHQRIDHAMRVETKLPPDSVGFAYILYYLYFNFSRY